MQQSNKNIIMIKITDLQWNESRSKLKECFPVSAWARGKVQTNEDSLSPTTFHFVIANLIKLIVAFFRLECRMNRSDKRSYFPSSAKKLNHDSCRTQCISQCWRPTNLWPDTHHLPSLKACMYSCVLGIVVFWHLYLGIVVQMGFALHLSDNMLREI